ncbi:hypothetical protein [Flavobacterium sp.]|uniref:hypothetical protein n=1 Tax=Flavobacterium sp. TaxID=239 RepID=UPI0026035FD9|nr:hypothetical protein [Flavobacterium sp.]MDD3005476.1 hypothetical protein [Flavobacterium sp.]
MKPIYLTLLMLLFISCNSNDDTPDNCIEFHTADIETVTPSAVADATGYFFDVGFRVINGCGQFYSFEQTTEENVTTIEVVAEYRGCICTQDYPLRQKMYQFTQTLPGTYTLKFKRLDGTFLLQTVTIGTNL